MAIIKCNNCGNDVSDKAKQCPHCGTTINDEDGIESILNNVKVKMKTSKNHTNTKRIPNKVTTKFNIVIFIIKLLGYFGAFICLITYTQISNLGLGLLICVIVCIVTWLSTLIFEAIAEGLQLLEDIKNKL